MAGFLHVKRTATGERVDAAFLGVGLLFWIGRSARSARDKFIVARPEGELVLDRLRLHQIARRMADAFEALVS